MGVRVGVGTKSTHVRAKRWSELGVTVGGHSLCILHAITLTELRPSPRKPKLKIESYA